MAEYKKCASCKYNTKEKSELPCCACIDFGIDFYKPMTNADRIRCTIKMGLETCKYLDCDGHDCKKCVLEWLQAEVKEGGEDERS